MLQFMGLQGVWHDLMTEQQQSRTEKIFLFFDFISFSCSIEEVIINKYYF